MVFNTGPYTVLPENSILNTANIQSETGFPSSHQSKPYVASKSRLKLAARAVLSADAGLLVNVTHAVLGARNTACWNGNVWCFDFLAESASESRNLHLKFKKTGAHTPNRTPTA